jgi:hypothetical protein
MGVTVFILCVKYLPIFPESEQEAISEEVEFNPTQS